jgi:dienelactone hydrolase
MVGNVREWTASAIGDEMIILGGNWNDALYIAGTPDVSAPALDRSEGNGIRLARTVDSPEVREVYLRPFPARSLTEPLTQREPVSDEIYAAWSAAFQYDRTPLNARTEQSDETRIWVRERITFDPAYDADRMVLHLYLPTTGRAPFQTVVYWSGWDTFRLDDIGRYFARQIDFIVKSGRAVAFPALRGTFERRVNNVRAMPAFNTVAWRNNTIDSIKDIRRTIDYLETRRDIDAGSLAFFGYSWGGLNGPITLAQEDRFKTAIISVPVMRSMPAIPDVEPLNSLPRIQVPTLVLSGEFDGLAGRDLAITYFDLIGLPADQKKHVIALSDHFIPRDLLIRESLDWLDRYLGTTGG